MSKKIVTQKAALEVLTKELYCNDAGEGFVTLRGLGRMCGVDHSTWKRGDGFWTTEIDKYLAESGIEMGQINVDQGIPRYIAEKVIMFYALKGNLKAKQHFNFNDNKVKRTGEKDVYIIQCSETRIIKIGISNNPLRRLVDLSTGYPFTLNLVRVIKTRSARKLEVFLHKALDDFKLNGEWFDGVALQMIGQL